MREKFQAISNYREAPNCNDAEVTLLPYYS